MFRVSIKIRIKVRINAKVYIQSPCKGKDYRVKVKVVVTI